MSNYKIENLQLIYTLNEKHLQKTIDLEKVKIIEDHLLNRSGKNLNSKSRSSQNMNGPGPSIGFSPHHHSIPIDSISSGARRNHSFKENRESSFYNHGGNNKSSQIQTKSWMSNQNSSHQAAEEIETPSLVKILSMSKRKNKIVPNVYDLKVNDIYYVVDCVIFEF